MLKYILCGVVDMSIRNKNGRTASDLLQARLDRAKAGVGGGSSWFVKSVPAVIQRLRNEEQRGH